MPFIVPPTFDTMPAIVRVATRSTGAPVIVQHQAARPAGTVEFPIMSPPKPLATVAPSQPAETGAAGAAKPASGQPEK
jgi:hypothetical protein